MRPSGLRAWLLLLVLAAAVPGLLHVFHVHSEGRERFEQELRATALNLARAAAATERATLEDARGFVSGLAELPSVKAHDGEECGRIFAALQGRYPTYANVGAAEPDGAVFCTAKPRSSPKSDIRDREYLARVLATRAPAAGEYALGKQSGMPTLHVAAPSVDARGEVEAVVFAGIDLRAMAARLESFPLPAGATIAVLDRHGVILAGTPDVASLAGRRAEAAGLALALTTPEGVSEGPGLDGKPRVHGHVAVSLSDGIPDLIVVSGVAREPLLGPSRASPGRTTVGHALVVLAGLVAAWLTGHLLLVRRLGRLAAVARRLSAGDLDARTGMRWNDEIGALARTFDEMAVAMDQLTRQNRLILESVGVGIYGVGRDNAITMMNPAAAAMLRFSPQEVIGRNAHELLHHHDALGRPSGSESCPLVAALADGQVRHGDGEVLWRSDGTSFPIEFVTTPIRDGGEIVGAVVTFHDITDRRQLESQLRQAQKIEAVGRLAGGIAHDFNNLLTAVLSIGHAIAEGLPAEHELQPEVADLISAGRKAAELTRQLLAFSRNQVLAPAALDATAVVRGLERMLAKLVDENVRVTTHLEATGHVLADRSQLEQVIVNLVVNARDAMARGGEIAIGTADVHREAGAADGFGVPPGRYVLVSVTDQGTGMDQHTLSRVFEPFFTTKGPTGTGLGLSTAYGIVKQSGGDIRVQTELGVGSRFEVLLPRCEAPAAASAEAALPGAVRARPSERVLVVEDNALVRAVTCRTLASAGYRVAEAASAEDALRARACAEPLDLLVADVGLPGLNGRELLERMRAERPGLKVLFVSGHTGDTKVDEYGAGGAFLQKPFTPGALLGRIRELLDAA